MASIPIESRRPVENSPHLADSHTPLIRNAWYVVATSEEITREPFGRDVMETSVVMFRSTNGAPVVLQNRCCHRSFPLAKGMLEGDSIRCGYHGPRYDTSGRCVEIPMQDKVPDNLRVRAYPAREHAPFVWAWFGDPAAVDEAALPHPQWLGSPDWDFYLGYLTINGSYVHMHENLLDLSHLSFLHPKTFGTPEYALAPVELTANGTDIQVWRRVTCELPDIYSVPLQWKGMKVLRSSGSQFVAPGLHVNSGILKNLEILEAEQQPIPLVKVAQIITPETRLKTHYWFAVCRNFARNQPEIDNFMRNAQYAAFAEDKFAIEQITRLKELDRDSDGVERHIPTDAPGIAMRRHLKALSDLEGASRQ
ncbi:MAG: aromatic ring-hydroxylating dioxygenase subunit alpha [Gammaproteobacteria bacterium]|nr:aromatic ring-hydroxylating dioxygenase subunit alpha [Gammaproteobacteria bacterium]